MKISRENDRLILDGRFFKQQPDDEGWVHCPVVVARYCGEHYNHNLGGDGKMDSFKLRILEPKQFVMSERHGNYIPFDPGDIQSIEIVDRAKGTVLDKISHSLTMEEQLPKN